MSAFEIRIDGRPVTQGSVIPFVAGNGRARVRYRPAVSDYRERLTRAIAHTPDRPARMTGGVLVELVVEIVRPKTHYRSGRHSTQLKPDAPHYPITKGSGDVDKYARLALDAITDSGIWGDDSQTVTLIITKRYAPAAALTLRIETMPR